MNNLEEKIKHLEKKLNDIKVVKGIWYRKSHCAYDMVCYINNIIALHHAENYEYIPEFIRRAKKFLLNKKPSYLNAEYTDLVINYIELMEMKLTNNQQGKNQTK